MGAETAGEQKGPRRSYAGMIRIRFKGLAHRHLSTATVRPSAGEMLGVDDWGCQWPEFGARMRGLMQFARAFTRTKRPLLPLERKGPFV
ncbi:hypothetical protein N185_08695 [Sinorhizobium sp. GW3]|nr:hypothetical protein N185_08695 [Sinorhizobium sp. GW3]